MTTIQIHTYLDERISGGGTDEIRYTWAAGPRNLIRAIRELAEHREWMQTCYGNIGCGGSWLQVGELRVREGELAEVIGRCGLETDTPTQRARELLEEIATGAYVERLAREDRWAREQEARDHAEYLAWCEREERASA